MYQPLLSSVPLPKHNLPNRANSPQPSGLRPSDHTPPIPGSNGPPFATPAPGERLPLLTISFLRSPSPCIIRSPGFDFSSLIDTYRILSPQQMFSPSKYFNYALQPRGAHSLRGDPHPPPYSARCVIVLKPYIPSPSDGAIDHHFRTSLASPLYFCTDSHLASSPRSYPSFPYASSLRPGLNPHHRRLFALQFAPAHSRPDTIPSLVAHPHAGPEPPVI